ncbi:hypothetical protein OG302_21640 [Streptomyces sp. NBC_01283]|uniref:hypothetical protein n=1 Tax=Streptomyces sp. NBC_01283 TaxID=2903812 RepID=UPI00352C9972|nr:hypothetical protein OG302_21640 [Streptomyces sp. NBC_01283]
MNPRLIALMGVVAITVFLPLAGASAGPVGDGDADAKPSERPADAAPGTAPDPDAKQPSTERPTSKRASTEGASSSADDSSLLTGLGLDTAAQCGPEVTSPKGIEAQTCVLTQGHDTWGRTYYRNTTGDELSAVLTVMGPGARTVQMHCAVGAADEPGACETPRERTAGNAEAYSAVVEFADGSGGPLLLRSGSNSARPKAS